MDLSDLQSVKVALHEQGGWRVIAQRRNGQGSVHCDPLRVYRSYVEACRAAADVYLLEAQDLVVASLI